MKDINPNPFSETEQILTQSDIIEVEATLNIKLPDDFIAHYLQYNGGIPERTYWFINDEDEPIEVGSFKPLKHNSFTIMTTYKMMLEKEVLPAHLLPFANDLGGNFFCLNLDSGTISYFLTDTFDDELSPQENQTKANTEISDSFSGFLNGLIHENDVYEDDE